MPEEKRKSLFGRMSIKSIESLRKTMTKLTKNVKSNFKTHTIEIEGKKFKNYKQLVEYTKEEISKTEEKYDKTVKIVISEVKAKIKRCQEKLGDKAAIADFNSKFLGTADEITRVFYSLRFLKGKETRIEGKDKNKKHNEEDFKLLCESQDFLDFMNSKDIKPMPKEFEFRSDGSKRENRSCSQVTYAAEYLPIIMTSYERDFKILSSNLTKLFHKMDKYVEDYETKKKWSKKPDKTERPKMEIGKTRANYIRKEQEEKIKAALKSGSEQQTTQQNENRFSSSRKNVVGRRKSTIKFDAKPKS